MLRFKPKRFLLNWKDNIVKIWMIKSLQKNKNDNN